MAEHATENTKASEPARDFNEELRASSIALCILNIQQQRLQRSINVMPLMRYLTTRPLNSAASQQLCNLYELVTSFDSSLLELGLSIHRSNKAHAELMTGWKRLLGTIVEGWKRGDLLNTANTPVHIKHFSEANRDVSGPHILIRDDFTLDSAWPGVKNYIHPSAGTGRDGVEQFINQAISAEMAFKKITIEIESQFARMPKGHLDHIHETVPASRGPYRALPLGGCTTIPSSIWQHVLGNPMLIKFLANSGNPLVVFQCVQDWMENGDEAVLPKMLAGLVQQEFQRVCGPNLAATTGLMMELQARWMRGPKGLPYKPEVNEGQPVTEAQNSGNDKGKDEAPRPKKFKEETATTTTKDDTVDEPAFPPQAWPNKTKVGRSPLALHVLNAADSREDLKSEADRSNSHPSPTSDSENRPPSRSRIPQPVKRHSGVESPAC
ncbi:unnamed protein product [Tilletia controversa]|uniref:Uncharacterized protein n=3 Tax=Tilletia TaxID=13289 RepID=A0A8X7SYQ0_9BASI|nr:hypothetical protein CF336_g2348 [Tilletia laevis]KAE8202487.1 hypothetical protein CF328_g2183 [Tilletia controversa]KAE8263666.1 hypothetical protein A4X03_0g1516 [Tilletia caries]KAE8206912.1 hypothetical protein CF335_g1527 [Tilletia laevis]KAE8252300.1 hypothetical protein A4X06_0g2291 [Tilletia controversa]